ncbi:glycosyltransferase family 4 protein [Okeania sp.]|uniref:glycosyltransferase family 4 protein n=1 Tax=Okeania sp. TaxID=3100323 RepID=UPI002B4AD59A|nr:glycosyltransferase family 4 protein [Okeania sp.]MEB3342543.1 glycosyltransferase family 4 protein [Okeania sp.]
MTIPSFRTLFIVYQLPYPPMGGSPLRNWQNINTIKKYGEVGVFSLSYKNHKFKTLPGINSWHNYNMNYRGSFNQRLAKKLSKFLTWRYPLFDDAYGEVGAKKLHELMRTFQPDLAIISQLTCYPYLQIVKNYKCKIIFDAHDIVADVFRQKSGLLIGGKRKLIEKLQLMDISSKEAKLIRTVDQIWVCSETDRKILQDLYGKNRLSYIVPNGINISDYANVKNDNCSLPDRLNYYEKTIIFIGSFGYQPNINAANFLIDKVYPRLRNIYPDCQLLLVGKDVPKELLETAKKYPNIICTGTVPDVKPYLAASSIVVTPLFEGGGTRLKILEAFAAGRPVVSTTKGVEGINAQDGKHLLIRDDVEGIIWAICQLWSDLSLGKKLTAAAYELVSWEYSWEAVAKKIEPAVKDIFR